MVVSDVASREHSCTRWVDDEALEFSELDRMESDAAITLTVENT